MFSIINRLGFSSTIYAENPSSTLSTVRRSNPDQLPNREALVGPFLLDALQLPATFSRNESIWAMSAAVSVDDAHSLVGA